VGDDRGALEDGKAADVVLLGGSPLDDISSVEDVRRVYLDGVRVA
jgi:imidazolonepropionase-like amidohydrolase